MITQLRQYVLPEPSLSDCKKAKDVQREPKFQNLTSKKPHGQPCHWSVQNWSDFVASLFM